jgi:hydrogenase maturation protease
MTFSRLDRAPDAAPGPTGDGPVPILRETGATSNGALVIAFGNPLREDDGVGWAVAEALQARGRVSVLTVHQLGPELAEAVSEARTVVFVDAHCDGPPGAVRTESLSPAPARQDLTHVLDPGTLLLYSQLLYGSAPKAAMVSIAGTRFGLGQTLSPAVRRALPEAVSRVEHLASDIQPSTGADAC